MGRNKKKLKNPVGDFTSNNVDTYDIIEMLCVIWIKMENYIKSEKVIPTRRTKYNYFEINQVKNLMHINGGLQIKALNEDLNWMA